MALRNWPFVVALRCNLAPSYPAYTDFIIHFWYNNFLKTYSLRPWTNGAKVSIGETNLLSSYKEWLSIF